MMILKATIYIVTASLALVSCESVSSISDGVDNGLTRIISRPDSFRAKGEKVSLKIIPAEGRGAPSNLLDGGVTAIVGGYVIGEVFKGLESAAKNFSMVYSGSIKSQRLEAGDVLELTRKIRDRSAATIRLRVESYPPHRMITVQSIQIQTAKAAIPWWDGDMDVAVKVNIAGGQGANAKDPNATLLDSSALVVKSLKAVGGGWSWNGPGDDEERPSTEFFKRPQGPMKITVSVEEFSDFHKTAEKGGTLIGDRKEEWQEKLLEVISGE